MANERKTVGLLVANITDPYSRDVSKGAMAAAKELGLDLVIFPGKYVGLENRYEELDTRYEYQHNILFDYAAYSKLDFVIATVGTIAFALDDDRKRDFLAPFRGTPLLCLSSDLEEYDCLMYDNRAGVASAMDYLIKHGRRRIGIMAGNPNNPDCTERFDEYKAALARAGIEFDERFAIECDIGNEAAPAAVELLERCPDMDACFCINDYVAGQFCAAVKAKGLEVGRDIAVVGFDDIPEASVMRPPLATIKADAAKLGERAMLKAYNYINSIPDDCRLMPTRFIPRNSCFSGRSEGALAQRLVSENDDPMKRRIADYADEMCEDEREALRLYDTLMGVYKSVCSRFMERRADLHDMAEVREIIRGVLGGEYSETLGAVSLQDIVGGMLMNVIRSCEEENLPLLERLYSELSAEQFDRAAGYTADEFAYRTHMDNIFIRDALMFTGSFDGNYAKILKRLTDIGCDTSYIVTIDDPITHRPGQRLSDNLHFNFRSYAYGLDTHSVPKEERRIRLDELFYDYRLAGNRRHTFIVADLYTASQQYGIAVLEPRTERFFEELELVTYQLSSAVRTLDIMQRQEELMDELNSKNLALESLSRIDELTGVLNRRGFFTDAESMIHDSPDGRFLVSYADMDDLKSVNDSCGHTAGDEGIRTVAECIRKMFGPNALIGRFGGDEFAAIVPAEGALSISEALALRDRLIDDFNSDDERPYTFGFSVGIFECVLKNSYDLSDAIVRADGKLYREKSRKKSARQQNGPAM
ncbi:MAG: GGDEF domain-containing protein [Ruminococcus sp.]|nr:GGDEF domain-containing protein [Ruminococcus sp.]